MSILIDHSNKAIISLTTESIELFSRLLEKTGTVFEVRNSSLIDAFLEHKKYSIHHQNNDWVIETLELIKSEQEKLVSI